MSKTGVIVALVIAIVLTGAAMFLLKKPGPGAATGPFLAFDPAKATSVTVARPGGGSAAIGRDAASGEWSVFLIGADGRELGRWPAAPERVRAALRILATLAPERPADAGTAPEAGACSIVVTAEGGVKQSMTMSERVLGGQVVVATGARAGWVASDVADMLVKSGPREWRDAAVLPGLGPDVSRITLKGQAGTVALARVQGKWGIREPVQELADPQSMVKLLTALSGLTIVDFLDGDVPAQTGLEKPIAELVIESDLRDGDTGAVTTARRVVRVGQQADLGGKTVYAEVGTGAGGRAVKLSAESLAALSTDPLAYCSKRSVPAPAADVGRVEIAGRKFERGLEGWRERKGTELLPLTTQDEERLIALVQVMTQQDAESVGLTEAPGKAVGSAELGSPGGAPLASLKFNAAERTDKSVSLVVKCGSVWRAYAPSVSGPLLAWLEALSGNQ